MLYNNEDEGLNDSIKFIKRPNSNAFIEKYNSISISCKLSRCFLNKQIASLQAAYSNPVGVDYDALYSSILKLSEILSGYDIRKSDLPAIIFKFKNQIEELKVETRS